MASTPPDILKNKTFRCPDTVRARIDELVLDYKLGATAILTKMLNEDASLEHILPSQQTLHKYVLWRRANPNQHVLFLSKKLYPEAKSIEDITESAISTLPAAEAPKPVDYDLGMLGDSKQTLEYLKKSVVMKIQSLEGMQQERFDKYTEQNLVNLYKILKDLVHSEVKLAEDLKDSESIALADVKNSIYKLFDAVYLTVDRLIPTRKQEFKQELSKVLKYYNSTILTDVSNEDKNEFIRDTKEESEKSQ